MFLRVLGTRHSWSGRDLGASLYPESVERRFSFTIHSFDQRRFGQCRDPTAHKDTKYLLLHRQSWIFVQCGLNCSFGNEVYRLASRNGGGRGAPEYRPLDCRCNPPSLLPNWLSCSSGSWANRSRSHGTSCGG